MVSALVGVALFFAVPSVNPHAEPFATPLAELRTLAAAPIGEPGVTWLGESVHWTVSADRQVHRVGHQLVRLSGNDAVERWSRVSLSYSPWYEAAPTVRARIITPDGRLFELTPDMVRPVEPPRRDDLVVSDSRSVIAALPGVRSGAVVELEVTEQTTQPHFAPAQAGRFRLSNEPTGAVHLVLEHPRALPLSVDLQHAPLVRTDEDVGDLQRVHLTGTDVAEPDGERSVIAWSTGASWQAVARGYLSLLDRVRGPAQGVDVKALLAGVTTRREKAQKLLDWVHAEVRYTGLTFGDRAIVPWSPSEVVQRGYGDCKDMALLFVELLRVAGVDASLALLDTEKETSVNAPSLASFDHAIVSLPRTKAEPALWVDVTAQAHPVGLLPSTYAGGTALVIDPSTTALTTLWAPTSADSQRAVTLDVTLPSYGAGQVRVTQTLTGLMATWARDGLRRDGPEWLDPEFKDLAKLIGVDALKPLDPPSTITTQPVVYGGEAARAQWYYTDWSQAVLSLPEGTVLDWLPSLLTDPEKHPDGPVHYAVPHLTTVTLRVKPPAGFVLDEPPADSERHLGPATLRTAARRLPDGTVELSSRLDTGPRDYTLEQADAFRADLAEWRKVPNTALRFRLESDLLRKQGKYAELMAWHAKQREPVLEAHQATDLLLLGLGDAARAKAAALTKQYPEAAWAWLASGWVLSYDVFGNHLAAGFDRPGAIRALAKARELEPACGYCLEQLSILQRADDEGGWLTDKVDKRAAVEAFVAAAPKDRSADWVALMTFVGDWKALKDGIKTPGSAVERTAVLLADQMLEGAAPAWKRWSSRFDRSQAQAAAEAVVATHFLANRLPEALAMSKEANTSTRALLERIDAQRLKPIKPTPERAVIEGLFAAALAPDASRRERFVADQVQAVAGLAAPGAFMTDFSRGMQSAARSARLTPELMALSFKASELKFEPGPRDAVRMTMRPDARRVVYLYLVKAAGAWRVLPLVSADGVALMAFNQFVAGHDADAKLWLGWARDQLALQGATPDLDAIKREWPNDERLFAAAMSPATKETNAALAQALEEAPAALKGPLVRTLLRAAMDAKAPADALKWSARLLEVDPDEPWSLEARAQALARAGDLPTRQAADEAWLRRTPGALTPMRDLGQVAWARGELVPAFERWREVAAQPRSSRDDLNNAAWAGLLTGDTSAAVLEWAKQAGAEKDATWGARHTLAVVLAARGGEDLSQAIELMRGLGADSTASSVWLVPAKVAEQLGLRDEARALYTRALLAKPPPASSAALAATWLADLDAPKPAAKPTPKPAAQPARGR